MPFVYPSTPHQRKHGPAGYTLYETYKDWLRDEFSFRCVYCLARERWYPNGHAGFGIDHVKPKGNPQYTALLCDYSNLVYACNRCNSLKQEEELIDPCIEPLGKHLCTRAMGTVEGLTAEGVNLIEILRLNDSDICMVRIKYLRILALYEQHAADPQVQALYVYSFGFPADLPNLKDKRPPSNVRPSGVNDCYFSQRLEGRLPEVFEVEMRV
jgi:hypothetical protein